MKLYKKLVAPLVVLLVLVIAAVSIYFINKNKNKATDPLEENYQVVLVSKDELDSITVEAPSKDTLVINSRLNGEGNVEFFIPGTENDGYEYSQDNFTTYLSVMLNYSTSTMLKSDGLNLADYGFDNPEYTVTIKNKNGETTKYYIGIDTISGGQCYVMVEGDSNIYVLPTAKKFFCDYEKVNFYAPINLDIDINKLAFVTFDRKEDDLHLKCSIKSNEEGKSSCTIIEPFQITAGDFFNNLINSVTGLSINSFVTLDEEEISKYKLDDPGFKFTFEYMDGSKEEVLLSVNDEYIYGYSSKLGLYFFVYSAAIQNYNAPLVDLIYDYVYYFYAKDVRKIECTYDGKTFTLTVDTEEVLSGDDSEVLLDGRNALISDSNGKSYASYLFGAFSCVSIGGIETRDNPKLENPTLSYTIIDKNFNSTTIDYVTKDSDSYYCFINGEYTGLYVYGSEFFNDGGTEFYNYGIIAAYELLREAIDNNMNGVYDRNIGE